MKMNWLWPTVLPVLVLSGCMHRPGERPMGGWDHVMGPFGYGGVFMWLILIILVGLIAYFLLEQRRKDENNVKSTPETALDILKKRYARGEISKDEFDRMKDDIDS